MGTQRPDEGIGFFDGEQVGPAVKAHDGIEPYAGNVGILGKEFFYVFMHIIHIDPEIFVFWNLYSGWGSG